MDKPDFFDPAHYINRELSWLEFNSRVLEEARDKGNPLFERLKFLSITGSNLDEFFMIRVGSIKDQLRAGFNRADFAGLTPKKQLTLISMRAHDLVETMSNTWNKSLLPLLRKNGVHVLSDKELDGRQRTFVREYFDGTAFPVLTPMAMDSSRPFPLILNLSLNLAVLMKKKDEADDHVFATVQVPSVLPRLVEIPRSEEHPGRCFLLLEDVLLLHLNRLFPGREIVCAYPYRITRNADLTLEEEEAQDLLIEIEKSLKKRRWGMAVRLEVHHAMDERLLATLKVALEIHDEDIYPVKGSLDPTGFLKLCSLPGHETAHYRPFEPQTPMDLAERRDLFEAIREKDIFLHHPYDSFDPVVEFLLRAAEDPDVLAIKQTLYRVSGDSPVVKALARAAEAKKQVMVLLEVKARFDEENNIFWAKQLEQAGCHVIYGLVGLKTHCKITLVVRREETGIQRYVHLGTGNYNDITARIYTDMGLFTCKEPFGADASSLFNMLSGYSEAPQWNRLEAAPIGLRKRFLSMLENERINALAGLPASLTAKMNSLVDPESIAALYRASAAGVKIRLIVRGICCLRPGIKGISDNISVTSIVGRFLEHSRILHFCNGGADDVYLTSADLMPRNLDRRVELLYPIEDPTIKERILEFLQLQWSDTAKARLLDSTGRYRHVDHRGKTRSDSQTVLCERAMEREPN
jgi:polyphosphate kinase